MKLPAAPDQVFKELFVDLHASKLWADGKMIADAIPLAEPEVILAEYRNKKSSENFDLKAFFEQYFQPNPSRSTEFKSDTSRSVEEHIERLWDPHKRQRRSSSREFAAATSLPLHCSGRAVQRDLLLG